MSQEERLKVVGIIMVLIMTMIFILPTISQANNNQIQPGDIIITEIMINPKAVSDTAGEWLEIYNSTENDIDLSECEFTDNGSNKFIISQLIVLAESYSVLARNGNANENGGLTPDYIYTSYTLTNTEDVIILTCQGTEIDRVEYSTVLGFTIPDGASIILKDLTLDNNVGANWCASDNIFGAGDKGTPQTDNGTCAETITPNPSPLITTNRPPIAEAGSNKTVVVGQTVQFDGSNSYDPDNDTLKYNWDFGDGNKATGKTTTHIYQQANIYLVTLTVDDGKISQSDSLSVTVNKPQINNYQNKLIISELMPNPEGSDEDEWIELYNQSSEPIDLLGLYIIDASNKKYTFNTDDFASMVIPANSYFLLPRAISKINLNNTPPETVAIVSLNNETINEVTYFDSAKEGWSLIFFADEYQWTNTPTPGYANQLNLSSEDSNINQDEINDEDNTNEELLSFNQNCQSAKNNQIILNELLPSPQGDDRIFEFIEIKNVSTLPANLCGWSVSDLTRQYFFPDNVIIPPLGFYLVEPITSHISLNNNGDQISLYNSNDELVDFTSYGKAGIDQSWARASDKSWLWTKNISPNEENIFSENTNVTNEIINSSLTNNTNEYVYLPLEEINQTQVNDKVIVTGIITAEPGRLGSQIMYIMNVNGLQIYQHFKRWPAGLTVGDRVEIKGIMSFPSGLPRLKVQTTDDIYVLEKNQFAKLVLPIVTTDELTEELIGSLITIVGTIVEIKKGSLMLADDQGEINLVIKPSTEINLPPIKEGDIIEVIGILDKTTAGWRLLPRFNTDLKIIEVKSFTTSSPILENDQKNLKNNFSNKLINYLYITLLAVIIMLSRLIYKLKKQQYGYTNNQKVN